MAKGGEVHVHHHRVDHHPYKDGDYQVDAGEFELGQQGEELGSHCAQRNAGADTQCYPETEEAFEKSHEIPLDNVR